MVTCVRAEPSRTQPLQLQLSRSLSFHAGLAQLSLKGRTLQHGAEIEARCQLTPWHSRRSRPLAQRFRTPASSTHSAFRLGHAGAANRVQSSRQSSADEEECDSALFQTSATAGLPGLLHGLRTYTADPKALMPPAADQLRAGRPGTSQQAGQPRRQLRRPRSGHQLPTKPAAAQPGPDVTRQRLQTSSVATPHMPGEAPCCSTLCTLNRAWCASPASHSLMLPVQGSRRVAEPGCSQAGEDEAGTADSDDEEDQGLRQASICSSPSASRLMPASRGSKLQPGAIGLTCVGTLAGHLKSLALEGRDMPGILGSLCQGSVRLTGALAMFMQALQEPCAGCPTVSHLVCHPLRLIPSVRSCWGSVPDLGSRPSTAASAVVQSEDLARWEAAMNGFPLRTSALQKPGAGCVITVAHGLLLHASSHSSQLLPSV